MKNTIIASTLAGIIALAGCSQHPVEEAVEPTAQPVVEAAKTYDDMNLVEKTLFWRDLGYELIPIEWNDFVGGPVESSEGKSLEEAHFLKGWYHGWKGGADYDRDTLEEVSSVGARNWFERRENTVGAGIEGRMEAGWSNPEGDVGFALIPYDPINWFENGREVPEGYALLRIEPGTSAEEIATCYRAFCKWADGEKPFFNFSDDELLFVGYVLKSQGCLDEAPEDLLAAVRK